jgi:hypothetical protein
VLVGATEPGDREGSGRAGPGRVGSEGGEADLVKWAGRRTRERELTAQACAKVHGREGGKQIEGRHLISCRRFALLQMKVLIRRVIRKQRVVVGKQGYAINVTCKCHES